MNSSSKNDWIDGSLYPDRDVPEAIRTLEERVDFLVRLCGAWDFGLPPARETLDEVLKPEWREAVEAAQMLTSCAYHVLRELHGLPEAPYLGPDFPEIRNDPCLELV